MALLRMQTDRLDLTIDAALGAGIVSFRLRKENGPLIPLMRSAPPATRWFNDLACYHLIPWSNRIAAGRFTWRERPYEVKPDWPDGTAIHGLTKDRPWRIVERTPVSAILEFSSREDAGLTYPWPFDASVRYELFDEALGIRLAIRNADATRPMPAGLGFHPFFPRSLDGGDEQVLIRYLSRGRYPADAMIPIGSPRSDEITDHLAAGRPLAALVLDDVFLGCPDGATITWPAAGVRLTYGCSNELGHAVLYTGLPDSFCFEPVTMVNDGFNLASRGQADTGVVELAPGRSLAANWTLRVGTL
jgi:aldose 1-epimerase